MTWNHLAIDLGAGHEAELTYGPGGLVYEAARLDVQETLDRLTGENVAFRGANRAWRRGPEDDFVMSHGRYVWCLYEEKPGEPTGDTAQRLAGKLITRLRQRAE
ncbi:hypothetical protein [Streptomyces albipurpureus]|uniref:Uncharacterized protein n=1 Tax=Streptomyces albipurpureus TaxID=2897419 RepID=A0ABT0UHF0_9ACTN|nr:hypothetical protein [Streptomyces sp. CWNU-1]MCM2386741.1 hypothetical protein [Streptomyces sp. CWNU-1]